MRLIAAILVALSLALGTLSQAGAQQSISVQLRPVGGSHVHGIASLSRNGAGTRVWLQASGLGPGTRAYGQLEAGRCADLAHLSASTAQLATLKANAAGRVSVNTSIKYHGTDVALGVLTDGAHVILIRQQSQIVACGTVPRKPQLSQVP